MGVRRGRSAGSAGDGSSGAGREGRLATGILPQGGRMRLRDWVKGKTKRGEGLQAAYLVFCQRGLWFIGGGGGGGCLLELEAKIPRPVQGGRLGTDGLWDPQKKLRGRSRGWGGVKLVFCCSARGETRELGLGEQKGRSHFLFLFTLHFLLQVRSLPG